MQGALSPALPAVKLAGLCLEPTEPVAALQLPHLHLLVGGGSGPPYAEGSEGSGWSLGGGCWSRLGSCVLSTANVIWPTRNWPC